MASRYAGVSTSHVVGVFDRALENANIRVFVIDNVRLSVDSGCEGWYTKRVNSHGKLHSYITGNKARKYLPENLKFSDYEPVSKNQVVSSRGSLLLS
jgi:hypothetical protein